MTALQRNQLVWLSAAGWTALAQQGNADGGSDLDPGLRSAVLAHWQSHDLPVVVCTQRGVFGDRPGAPVSVGLPAPSQWQRCKLALSVHPEHIARSGPFPSLADLLAEPQGPLRQALHAGRPTPHHRSALPLPPLNLQVYGSFGWHYLSGLDYVHPRSDLDVIAAVTDTAEALHVAQTLEALDWPLRIDGELAFPDGSAIAWREFLMRERRQVAQVLVKRRTGVALA